MYNELFLHIDSLHALVGSYCRSDGKPTFSVRCRHTYCMIISLSLTFGIVVEYSFGMSDSKWQQNEAICVCVCVHDKYCLIMKLPWVF